MSKKRVLGLLITSLLIMISFQVMLSEEIGAVSENNGEQTSFSEKSRASNEEKEKGGYWYDDFSDLSNVQSYLNAKYDSGDFKLDIVYRESYEDYAQDENLFGRNGWIEDTTRVPSSDYHEYTATSTAPGSPPTTMVGKVYNPDDEHSLILSDSFNVQEGTLFFWMCTENIFFGATGSMSTLVSLMKSNSATPPSSDRVVSIILRDGGLGYRIDPTVDSIMILSSGVTENTWYFFEVAFNCTTEKADINIYNSAGTLLGSARNTDFISSTSSIQRIELSTVRDHEGEYTTAYWDEISIIDKESLGDGTVRSKAITIPDDQEWSTLKIDKEEPEQSRVELEILDSTLNPIPGFNYDLQDDELDLSYLNTIGITSIILKATLKRGPSSSPILKGWGVEWQKSGIWRDTFLTTLKTSVLSNIEISQQTASLVGGPTLGMIESVRIAKPQGHYWGDVELDSDVSYPSEILIDLLDGDTRQLIPGFNDLDGPIIDLHDLDPFRYDSIIMRGRFFNFETTPLNLRSWSVDWELNTPPVLNEMISPSWAYRDNNVTMTLDITDPDQSLADLDISVDYSPPGSDQWFRDIIEGPAYDEIMDQWAFNFTIGKTLDTGFYRFKVEITDEFMATTKEIVLDDVINVTNNPPTAPEVSLSPMDPKTNTDITARITTPGTDIETGLLVYTFRWFVNDMELIEHMAQDVWVEAEPSLPSREFYRGDVIRCDVVSKDGEDISSTSSAYTSIGNSPPISAGTPPSEVTIHEDANDSFLVNLFEEFIDVNSDDLLITFEGQGNVEYYLLESNGSLMGSPKKDWFGTDNVTVTLSDGLEEIEYDLTVLVEGVNDLPEGEIVTPEEELEIDIGDTVEFEAYAEDVETSFKDLTFTWLLDDQEISSNIRFERMWEEAGEYNISCLVSDGIEEVVIGNILLTVIDTTPVFVLEDFARSHTSLKGAVMYDIIDMEGSIADVRDTERPGLDIRGLTSELIGNTVKITMQLEGAPLDPNTVGSLIEVDYSIYFVLDDWSETIFDSTQLTPDHVLGIVPREDQINKVGIYLSSGHLGYGTYADEFGSPVVEGNSIVWRVSAELVFNTLSDMENMKLYGVVTFTEQTSEKVIQCFDTVGHGAVDHTITGSPELGGGGKGAKDDGTISPALIIVFILIIVILLIIVIVLVFIVMRKKDVQPQPVQGADEVQESLAEPMHTGFISPDEQVPQPQPAVKEPVMEEPLSPQPPSPPVPQPGPEVTPDHTSQPVDTPQVQQIDTQSEQLPQ